MKRLKSLFIQFILVWDKIKIGIVGLGGIANQHITELLNCQDAVITAICDVSEKAIEEKKSIAIRQRGKKHEFVKKGVPCGIYHNMITGRRYVKLLHKETFSMIRIDKIEEIDYLKYDLTINSMQEELNKIIVTINVEDSEQFIIERIYREIDKDNIETIDDNTYNLIFKTHNLYDLIPYIRTYFGRIIKIECSDKLIEKKLRSDLLDTLNIYNDGDEDVS